LEPPIKILIIKICLIVAVVLAVTTTAWRYAEAYQQYLDEVDKEDIWVTHTGYFPDSEDDSELIFASVNGQRMHGDRLRVQLSSTTCNFANVWTTFAGIRRDKELLRIRNKPIKAVLSIMETSRQSPGEGTVMHIDAKFISARKVAFGYMALVDLHRFRVDKLKELLAGKYEVALRIEDKKQLRGLSSLDPDENRWSLKGVGDALDRASKVCLKKKSLDPK